MSALLEALGVTKRFGGVEALIDVSFSISRGQIFGLIGPNGAGKTTLFNLLTGLYPADGGRFLLDGRDLAGLKPDRIAARGIGRTFQNIRLFPALSALENVMVGGQRENNPIEPGDAALRARALAALDFVGMRDKAEVIVKSLPYGHRRLVEIARALAGHPKVLLLDEPAAGLNTTEKLELTALLKKLRGAHGLTIFLIEHDMLLVESLSDTITVINFGKKIAEGTPAEVLRHPDVVAAYLGEPGHAAA